MVTFTLVLIVLPRNRPALIFPTTLAVITPGAPLTIDVLSVEVEVLALFQVILTVVFVGPAARVPQVLGFVPLVEPFDVPLVTPLVPVHDLTGRLKLVVWIFGVVPRPGENVTKPDGFAHVRTVAAPAGCADSTPIGAINAMAMPIPNTLFNFNAVTP
jgi:hypothetical protein